MATTISNPASFSSVRSAFNAEDYGISSSLYAYRFGGGIVPGFNTGDDYPYLFSVGDGTSGNPLKLSQFSGLTVPTMVSFASNYNIGTRYYNPGYFMTNSSFGIQTDGYMRLYTVGDNYTYTYLYRWIAQNSKVGNYEVYATQTAAEPGSALSGGTLNSWVQLSSNQNWQVTSVGNSPGFQDVTLSLSIRKVGTTTVIQTWTINLACSSYL